MNHDFWLILALVGVVSTGCGRQEPARTSSQTPQSATQRLADDARQSLRRESNQLQDQWQRVASDVQKSVERTQSDLDAQLQRERQEMAEFAARMAEDAKDRAMDIPDILDEFFGSGPPRRREGARGEGRGPRR